jgi:hypothetical protein
LTGSVRGVGCVRDGITALRVQIVLDGLQIHL